MDGFIKAENAAFQYGQDGFQLRPATIDLFQGQIAFLKGPNGSGKSTMGKVLSGILKPGTGRVLIDGTDTKKMSLGEIGKRIGYLWQKPEYQLFAPTVIEELTFVDDVMGYCRKDSLDRAEKWLDYFDLAKHINASVYQLSRGEKQRLALATVMQKGCRYLILDEPTTGLDQERKDSLGKLLSGLREEEVGILIISHDFGFAYGLADRVFEIDDGRLFESC